MGEFRYKTKGINAPNLLNKIARSGARLKGCKRQDKSLFFTVSSKDCKSVEKSLVERDLEYQKKEKSFVWEIFSPARIGIILGLIICFFAVLFLSNFFFKTEIWGLTAVEQKEVEKFLTENGVDFGKKSDLDLKTLEKSLLEKFPFSVVGAKFEGMTLVVKVKEELSPSYYFDETKKQSMYATENAVVTRVIRIEGTQAVEVGKSVKAGDVLILNQKTVGDSVLEVRAIGEVYGRVWRECEVFIPETTYSYEDTGTQKIFYGVSFFKTQKFDYDAPFRYWRREETVTPFAGFIPIYHVKTTYFEQRAVEIVNPNYLDYSYVLARVKSEMEVKIQNEEGKILRVWHTVRDVKGGKVLKLTVEIEKRIDENR